MTTEYSISPHGEKFQLPGPDDYGNESERLKVLVSQQRSSGREIVVVMGVGFVGAVMAAVIADTEDKKARGKGDRCTTFSKGLKSDLRFR